MRTQIKPELTVAPEIRNHYPEKQIRQSERDNKPKPINAVKNDPKHHAEKRQNKHA